MTPARHRVAQIGPAVLFEEGAQRRIVQSARPDI
jgi:hypothetical protein